MHTFLKGIYMAQKAEKDEGDDEPMTSDDIIDWTSKTPTECTTIARDRKRWKKLVVLWSPTFGKDAMTTTIML